MIDQAQKAEITTVSIQESIADVNKNVHKIMSADKTDSETMQDSGAGGDSKETSTTSGQDSNEKLETLTDTETSGVQESAGGSKSEAS